MKKAVIIAILIILVVLGVFIYFSSNYDKKLADINEIRTDKNFENVEYDNVKNVEIKKLDNITSEITIPENLISKKKYENSESQVDEKIIGILEISNIGLKAEVKEGSDSDVLKNYIGHIETTPKYDGNVALAAHNRGYEFSYFARLNELKIGDCIKYITKFYERPYKVIEKKAVFETDLSVLENTNENMLTLITCITNKRNQRLCVKAIQI